MLIIKFIEMKKLLLILLLASNYLSAQVSNYFVIKCDSAGGAIIAPRLVPVKSAPILPDTVAWTFGIKQNKLNGTGFVKTVGEVVSYDNSTYLTAATAASTYQVAGNYASGISNTGDNAVNTLYSGLATSKQNTIPTGTITQYFKGDLSLGTLDKSAIGLSSVDNTSDATKNSASANLSSKTIATFNYAADANANDSYSITLNPAAVSYTAG